MKSHILTHAKPKKGGHHSSQSSLGGGGGGGIQARAAGYATLPDPQQQYIKLETIDDLSADDGRGYVVYTD